MHFLIHRRKAGADEQGGLEVARRRRSGAPAHSGDSDGWVGKHTWLRTMNLRGTRLPSSPYSRCNGVARHHLDTIVSLSLDRGSRARRFSPASGRRPSGRSGSPFPYQAAPTLSEVVNGIFFATRFREREGALAHQGGFNQILEQKLVRWVDGERLQPTRLGYRAWGAGQTDRLPRSISALSVEDSVNLILHILEQAKGDKQLRGDPRISRPGQMLVDDLQRWSWSYGVTKSTFRIALSFLVRIQFVILTPLDAASIEADRAALVRGRPFNDLPLRLWPNVTVPLREAFIHALIRPPQWTRSMLQQSLVSLLSEAGSRIEKRIHQIARTCDREYVLGRATRGSSPRTGMSLAMVEAFMRWIYPGMADAQDIDEATSLAWEAGLSRVAAADRSRLDRIVIRDRLLQSKWFAAAVVPLLEQGIVRFGHSEVTPPAGGSPLLVLRFVRSATNAKAWDLPQSAMDEADAGRAAEVAKRRARAAQRRGDEATRDAEVRWQVLTSMVAEQKAKRTEALDELARWFAAAGGREVTVAATTTVAQVFKTTDIARLSGLSRRRVLDCIRKAGVPIARPGQTGFTYSQEQVRRVLSAIQNSSKQVEIRENCAKALLRIPG